MDIKDIIAILLVLAYYIYVFNAFREYIEDEMRYCP
jgi:cytochrome bd-type quinol oxidase subunit 2